MTIHDIAIRVDKTHGYKRFLNGLNKTCCKFIWFKEHKKKSGLTHYHGRLHITSKLKYGTYCKYLRTKLSQFYEGQKMINPWWVGTIKSSLRYNRYIAKEGDLWKSNYSETEKNEIYETVKLLKVEQVTPMKEQLVKSYNSSLADGNPIGVLGHIIEYHVSRDYLPPNPTLLRQYAMYIEIKCLDVSSLCALDKYYPNISTMETVQHNTNMAEIKELLLQTS